MYGKTMEPTWRAIWNIETNVGVSFFGAPMDPSASFPPNQHHEMGTPKNGPYKWVTGVNKPLLAGVLFSPLGPSQLYERRW